MQEASRVVNLTVPKVSQCPPDEQAHHDHLGRGLFRKVAILCKARPPATPQVPDLQFAIGYILILL